MKVNDPGGAIEAARALLSRGCGAVVVTLGANGAVYVDNDRVLVVPGLSVPVVDTVAAGDAFCGAFASALARGEGVEDGLARATAAGALAVGVAGRDALSAPGEGGGPVAQPVPADRHQEALTPGRLSRHGPGRTS